MKILLLILLLFAPLANAIQVSGEGRSFEEAKHNAFRNAIELSLGVIVSAEAETRNDRMVRDEVLAYSAGYVTNYKVIDQTTQGNKIILIMDVTVAESKLKDFLLSKPSNIHNFDHTYHQVQLNTYFHERKTGDDLIKVLFNHYPSSAFTLTQYPYQFKTDGNRGIMLVVPYEFRWNYGFISALNETLSHTKDSEYSMFRPSLGKVTIEAKDPKDLILGRRDVYYFNDLTRMNLVRNSLIGENEPRLLLTISNVHNKNLINICVFPKYLTGRQRSFYGIGQPRELKIHGNEVERHEVRLELGRGKIINVRDIHHVELSLVRNKDCYSNRYR